MSESGHKAAMNAPIKPTGAYLPRERAAAPWYLRVWWAIFGRVDA